MSELYPIITLTSVVTGLLLSVYVLRQNWRSPANISFSGGLILISLFQFSLLALEKEIYFPLTWFKTGAAAISLAPPFLLAFSLSFLRKDHVRYLNGWKWALALTGLSSAVFFMLSLRDSLVQEASYSDGNYYIRFSTAGRYFVIYILITIVMMLYNLESTFRRAGSEKKKIKVMLFGLTATAVAYFYICSVALLYRFVDLLFIASASWVLIFAHILSGYSILRYKLLDSTIVIGRQVVYSSLTLFLAGGFLLLLGMAGKFLHETSGVGKILPLAALVFWASFLTLSIFTSDETRRRIREFVNRNFYRYEHDYRKEWLEFGRQTSSIVTLDETADAVLSFIESSMQAPRISVILIDDMDRITLFRSSGGAHVELNPDEVSSMKASMEASDEPVLLSNIEKVKDGEAPSDELRKAFSKLGADVLVPLKVKGKLIGVLSLGGIKLSREDLVFLSTVANQISVVMNNARLSEELASSKELESFYAVSSFITHDLKNCVSMLSMLADNAADNFDDPEFQRDALETITATVGKMQDLISKLSTIPREPKPSFSECDVNSIARNVIARFSPNGKGEIQLKAELQSSTKIRADAYLIERAIENLILNGIESLDKSGSVVVRTWDNGNFVKVEVEDTGCGMSKDFIERKLFKPFQSTKKKGLGIGLYQTKSIIEAHGGKIEVKSREGEGTAFTLSLPVKHEPGE